MALVLRLLLMSAKNIKAGPLSRAACQLFTTDGPTDKRRRSLCSLLVRRGHPVWVLGGRLGVAQDGLARVAVVRLVQGDVLDDERRQGAAVRRHSSSATCGETQERDEARRRQRHQQEFSIIPVE